MCHPRLVIETRIIGYCDVQARVNLVGQKHRIIVIGTLPTEESGRGSFPKKGKCGR